MPIISHISTPTTARPQAENAHHLNQQQGQQKKKKHKYQHQHQQLEGETIPQRKLKINPTNTSSFFFCCTSHPPDPIYIPFGFDLFLKHHTIKIGFGFTGSPGIGGKFATLFISLRLGWRGGGRGFIKRKSEILFIVERRAMFR